GHQDFHAHLARTRSGIVVLHHSQDLGPAEALDDDALHRNSPPSLVSIRAHPIWRSPSPSRTDPPVPVSTRIRSRAATTQSRTSRPARRSTSKRSVAFNCVTFVPRSGDVVPWRS